MKSVWHVLVFACFIRNSPIEYELKYSGLKSSYYVGNRINGGTFGDIFEAWDTLTNEKIVIKEPTSIETAIQKAIIEEYDSNMKIRSWELDSYDQFLLFRDTNILNSTEETYKDQPFPWLAYDYYEKGDVFTFVNRMNVLSHRTVQFISYDIATALKLINDNGYLHNDLKLENLLITQEEDSEIRVKLIDYGGMKTPDLSFRVGSIAYMAPEKMISNYPFPISMTSDMWSFGICLHILKKKSFIINNQPNFDKWKDTLIKVSYHELGTEYPDFYRNTIGLYKKIEDLVDCNHKPKDVFDYNCKVQKDENDCYCDLLLKCLVFDPNKRITPAEVLNHGYFEFVQILMFLGLSD